MVKIPEHCGFCHRGPRVVDQVATGTGQSQVSDIGDWRHSEGFNKAKVQGARCGFKLPDERLYIECFFRVFVNVLDSLYRHLSSGRDFSVAAASGCQRLQQRDKYRRSTVVDLDAGSADGLNGRLYELEVFSLEAVLSPVGK